MLRVFRFPPHRLHLWSHRTAGTEQRRASSSRKATDLWEDPRHVCAYLSCVPCPCPPQHGGFSVDEKLTFSEQSGIVLCFSSAGLTDRAVAEGPNSLISVAGTGICLLPKTCLIFCSRWLEGMISLPVFWAHSFCTSQEAFKINVAPVLPLAGKQHIRNEAQCLQSLK